ncbi:MAG: Tripartite tricarboxylate transporter (TTT) class transporter [Candidatus Methanohalarchaeum thermophilum]|uniref:Tripartite tricarboxylate transporter (TTT) class transporter n=1 Tax=Methanohalarchaeum thermophilum TaxID=1903181 RepID=A0A1Q6DUC9_METT1|nr:MAG: Tripartite tricarboxylate transporter (TTT) class transporter [Candidatus Methanohalarchaeum thermophilum]
MFIGVIGTIIGFIITVALIRKDINYGAAMIIGALFIAITNRFTPTQFIQTTKTSLTSSDTLTLVVLVIFIYTIAYGMKETNQVDRILNSFRRLISSRGTVAAIPTIFGFLPMPGGALMSAPIMEPEAEKLGGNAEQKTLVNFWFRHFIFFIFPFSPDLVLAAKQGGINLYDLIAIQIPVTVIALILGYFFYVKPLNVGKKPDKKTLLKDTSKIIWNLTPVLVPIIINAFFNVKLMYVIPLGLIILLLQNHNRLTKTKTAEIIKEGFPPKLVFAVIGIMFFRYIVKSSGSLTELINSSRAIGVPLLLIAIILPFMIGVITGIGMATIGISFPLLLPLIPNDPIHISMLFISSYLGYLISPVHLCLVVTIEYFGSNLKKNLKELAKPVSIIMAYNIIIMLLFF